MAISNLEGGPALKGDNLELGGRQWTYLEGGKQLSENDDQSNTSLLSPCLCSLFICSRARNHLGRCDQHGASPAMDFSRKRRQAQMAP